MKDELPISNEELTELQAKRSNEDKLKDALIHMIFVARKMHPYDPQSCAGCNDAKLLSGLPPAVS
jgi:hypothetical protein